MSTASLISSDQCRGARALLGWTQAELASRAGVIRANVVMFEGGHAASIATRRRVQEALEAAGVVFVRADSAGGAGVVLAAAASAATRPHSYAFDSQFYESQARLIASVARHPAYTDLRESLLSLSRDYYLQARQLATSGGASSRAIER